MVISGSEIAERILFALQQRVDKLQNTFGVTPKAAVIRIGDDSAISSYINQKRKAAAKIGAIVEVFDYPQHVTEDIITTKINQLQSEQETHGIILQLPLPKHLDQDKLLHIINPKLDIDGFHPHSYYPVPLAAAVLEVLKEIHFKKDPLEEVPFLIWLQSREIIVIGKGKTGGEPTIDLLRKIGLQPVIIDSKTPNVDTILKQGDIIITSVGKKHILTPLNVKHGVILLGVGMNKDVNGKFYGDYEEEEMKEIASFYTSIPGGIGPVNVAKLMENLVISAENTTKN